MQATVEFKRIVELVRCSLCNDRVHRAVQVGPVTVKPLSMFTAMCRLDRIGAPDQDKGEPIATRVRPHPSRMVVCDACAEALGELAYEPEARHVVRKVDEPLTFATRA